MEQYLSGITTIAFTASGIFFLKFWLKTSDRFFFLFAISFFLLALERLVMVMTDPLNEVRPALYLIRLAAFVLIIAAVIGTNRKQRQKAD